MITHVKEKRNKTPHIVKEYVTARDVSEPERWLDDQKKTQHAMMKMTHTWMIWTHWIIIPQRLTEERNCNRIHKSD